MDRTPTRAYEEAQRAISGIGLPLELRRLPLRSSGSRHFADVVVAVPPEAAMEQGHAAADAVERAITAVLPGSDVVVHVERGATADSAAERVLAAAYNVGLVREAHNVHVVRLDHGLDVKLPAT